MGAGEGLAVSQLVECRVFAAFPAYVAQSITNFHNADEAGVIVRELREELANRIGLDIALALSGCGGALSLTGRKDWHWIGVQCLYAYLIGIPVSRG